MRDEQQWAASTGSAGTVEMRSRVCVAGLRFPPQSVVTDVQPTGCQPAAPGKRGLKLPGCVCPSAGAAEAGGDDGV